MKKSYSFAFIAGFFGFYAMNIAQAMPTLGDDVVFSSVRVNAGAVITGTFEMKLVSFQAGDPGDPSSGKWSEKQITTENGVSKVENEQIPGSALLTDSEVALILTHCTAMGGTLQTVTVPAGSFSTCAIPSKSDFSTGTLWVAQGVVFGIVQEDFTQPDGTHTVLQLVSQTAGQ